MKRIRYLRIIRENLEGIILMPDDLKLVQINNISETMSINSYQYNEGEVINEYYADVIVIHIKSHNVYSTFDGMITYEDLCNKIKERDITQIHIFFEDGEYKQIKIRWYDLNNTYIPMQEYQIFDDFLKIYIRNVI